MGLNLKLKAGALIKLYFALVFLLLSAFSLEAKTNVYEFRLEAGSGFYYALMSDFNNNINEVNQAYKGMGLSGTLQNINILVPVDLTLSWLFGDSPKNITAFYLNICPLFLNYPEDTINYSNRQKAYDISTNILITYLGAGFRKYFPEYRQASGFNPYLGGDLGAYLSTGQMSLTSYYSDGEKYAGSVTPDFGASIGGNVEIGCDVIKANWPDFTLKTGYRYVSGGKLNILGDISLDFSGFYIIAAFIFGA